MGRLNEDDEDRPSLNRLQEDGRSVQPEVQERSVGLERLERAPEPLSRSRRRRHGPERRRRRRRRGATPQAEHPDVDPHQERPLNDGDSDVNMVLPTSNFSLRQRRSLAVGAFSYEPAFFSDDDQLLHLLWPAKSSSPSSSFFATSLAEKKTPSPPFGISCPSRGSGVLSCPVAFRLPLLDLFK